MTRPNYIAYHESLTDELHALKDRVRNLARHWPTDGEFKEAALRAVLRRHLPESFIVGRGFIVTSDDSSTQIDLLIVDGNKPTLFRDGDLMFVTPDCAKAVVEVKTSLHGRNALISAVTRLAQVGRLCRDCAQTTPWLGLFVYECGPQDDDTLLDAVEQAYVTTGIPVDCIAYGKDRFVRFWSEGELELGDELEEATRARWREYELEHLASSYFIGNVLDSLSNLDNRTNSYAWFPLSEGKKVHMRSERLLDDVRRVRMGATEADDDTNR